MTPEQWHLVPNSILRDGTEFLGWLADRGLRAPTSSSSTPNAAAGHYCRRERRSPDMPRHTYDERKGRRRKPDLRTDYSDLLQYLTWTRQRAQHRTTTDPRPYEPASKENAQ
jgi:hypothetical protein